MGTPMPTYSIYFSCYDSERSKFSRLALCKHLYTVSIYLSYFIKLYKRDKRGTTESANPQHISASLYSVQAPLDNRLNSRQHYAAALSSIVLSNYPFFLGVDTNNSISESITKLLSRASPSSSTTLVPSRPNLDFN